MKAIAFLKAAVVMMIANLAVSTFGQQSDSTQFSPGQSLGIVSVPNLRDIGGYRTSDEQIVRKGLLYRSGQLNPITPEDLEKIAVLNLKTDFDLRTAEEVKAYPDELGDGVKRVWLNVLADSNQSDSAAIEKLLKNPQKANAALGSGKAQAMLESQYREYIYLPSARRAFREFFVSISQADQLPALLHCTAGKDRTGWATAALLTLFKVPKEKIMEDYLRSNEYDLVRYRGITDAFVAAGGEESIPLAIFGAKPEYLNAAFDEMQKRYGTIENYFSQGLGIDSAAQNALRSLYLDED
jgi:protein-tyrosine phosphatase